MEQNHWGIKQRYYPTQGFGVFESAQQFCQVYDEVRNLMRLQCCVTEVVFLSERSEQFIERVGKLSALF